MMRRNDFPKMRGIEAFLSTPTQDVETVPDLVPIHQLKLPARQPRRYFDPDKLQRLTDSVREHGILEPLLVRPLPDGAYELVAGERRYRAAQAAGLEEVPIVVRDLSDLDALQLALVENLQREDLNPVEETEGILELLSISQELSKDEVITLLNRGANAKKRNQPLTDNVVRQLQEIEKVFAVVGRTTLESFRVHRLPLLNLPSEILEALQQGKIAYTKARVIAQVKQEVQRQALLEEAIAQNLPLSEIKERVKALRLQPQDSFKSLKTEVKQMYQKLARSQCWTNPEKQDQIKKLLKQMESILADES